MPAPPEIIALVANFHEHVDAYRSGGLNETEVRVQFIDPLFAALGWDIHNKHSYAEAYKDVVHEDAIKIGGATKAPDYSFRIGGVRKYFVEAKKPSINIKGDPVPAFQLRRYAWSAKLPLSIVTDFEEFAVYDCRVRPEKTDKASTARTLYLTYDQYVERWDEIAAIFSLEAIKKGSFDKYAHSKKKRGTAEVDDEFLKEIERWREVLAKNIALRNPNIGTRELNFAVQKTIDRIIFLRICEDRGIEPIDQLRGVTNGKAIYPRLCQLFRAADARYNSGLFHFEQEKGRVEDPDQFTLSLAIDDKTLKEIIRNLYYPDSPYEFSVLPADILGQVYEQFLGKVIRLTAAHQAKVEEKPEVRKAGGVYYTPTYIVDYIVENTVGKLVADKTPREIAARTKTWKPAKGARPLSVLDPACGSGSFLIGAYQFLLDWYLKWYRENDPQKYCAGKEPRIYEVTGEAASGYRLTTAEKKRILLDHIYGVDIDQQAVEVTKLSLLLKVLEGETQETLQKNLFAKQRALPDLSENIKCGNSLIGPDFWHDQQMELFDEDERLRINTFDWNAEFASIMGGEDGGFDAVIGNPPYVFTRNKGFSAIEKKYFYEHYKHQSIQLNTFAIFAEHSHNLLSRNARLGFITPNNWLTIDTFAPLRDFIIHNCGDVSITNIRDRVFAAANVDTAITTFSNCAPTKLEVCEMESREIVMSHQVDIDEVKPPSYIIQISLLKDPKNKAVVEKIELRSKPLSDFCTVSTGLKVYQTGKGKPPQTDHAKNTRAFHATEPVNDTFGPYLDGVDVQRYSLGWSGEYLSYGNWIAEPRRSVPFDGDRILVRQIPASPPYLVHGVFTSEPYYNDINSMVVFDAQSETPLEYLLGMINSRLVSYWFLKTYDKLQRKIFPQFKVKELAKFPIYYFSSKSRELKQDIDRVARLAKRMLKLRCDHSLAKQSHQRTALKRQITATDAEIDRLVYQLYGLTDEEIRLVEEATT